MWTATDLLPRHLAPKERAALGGLHKLLTRFGVLASLNQKTDPTLVWQAKAVRLIRDEVARVAESRQPLVLAHAAARTSDDALLALLAASGADLGLAATIGQRTEIVVPV